MPDQEIKTSITKKGGSLTVNYGKTSWIESINIGFPINGKWSLSRKQDLVSTYKEELVCSDKLGEFEGYQLIYSANGEEYVALRVKNYPSIPGVIVEAEALKDLQGLALGDSFANTTFNAPIFTCRDSQFLLYTFGNDDKFPGWPEAILGQGKEEIPENQAFTPLILLEKDMTLVVSPLSHYLVSALRTIDTSEGVRIARGVHGSIDFIPQGTSIKTIFVFGDGLVKTLYKWGDLLLKLGNKERVDSSRCPLLKKLGYWNAWGGYYAETFAGMNEETLLDLANYSKEEDIPIKYCGLDLWYYYDQVGFAKCYEPSLQKYPHGLKDISQKTDLPFFLHLSAFDKDNLYSKHYAFSNEAGDDSSYPTTKKFYLDLAKKLKQEGAFGVWHDWLRTQQAKVEELRSNLSNADEWFSWIAQGFEKEDLVMMLCMQTMGFLLASTQFQNVIGARSYTDYLFKQEGQIKLLKERSEDFDPVKPQEYLKNELLMGLIIHALGMYPFNDLFVTNSDHPEGFADHNAHQEALMRILSTGPVGIGDKIGETGTDLIQRMVFPDGTLAKPDHPLYPLPESLGEDILVAYTESKLTDKLRWIYLVIINLGDEELPYRVDTHNIYPQSHLIYDYFNEQVVKDVNGSLQAADTHYYVLTPKIGQISFIGFANKFITAPSSHVINVNGNKANMEVTLSAPPGNIYPLKIHYEGELDFKANGAQVREINQDNNLYTLRIKPQKREFSVFVYEKAV